MESAQLLLYLLSLSPAIVVGVISYFFFKSHTDNEDGRRRFLLQKDAQKYVLPNRLQAYERFVLFLERMDPNSLLVRVKPKTNELDTYENMVISNIENEFEHNLTQQMYITPECWNIIRTSKNATIQLIRQTSMNEKVDSADKLRETLLNHFMSEVTPSQKALVYVKKEVSELY